MSSQPTAIFIGTVRDPLLLPGWELSRADTFASLILFLFVASFLLLMCSTIDIAVSWLYFATLAAPLLRVSSTLEVPARLTEYPRVWPTLVLIWVGLIAIYLFTAWLAPEQIRDALGLLD